MTAALLGQLAGLVVALALVPYLVSILAGRTRPSVGAYLIRSVVGVVMLASYLASGASTTVWTAAVFAGSALAIFALSLRFGVGGFGRFDAVCLAACLISVGLWFALAYPAVALYSSIAVTLVGSAPLLRKLYRHPGTESPASWLLTLAGEALNLCALTTLAPEIALLPLTEALTTAAVVALILRQRSLTSQPAACIVRSSNQPPPRGTP